MANVVAKADGAGMERLFESVLREAFHGYRRSGDVLSHRRIGKSDEINITKAAIGD